MTLRHSLVGLLAALSLGGAAAQPYLSLASGESRLKLDCSGAHACERVDSAYRLFGGYRLNSFWAVEAGYLNFGEARVAVDMDNLRVRNDAVGGGVAFFAPLGDWTLVGRLGLARVATKLEARSSLSSYRGTDANAATYVGMSLGYQLTKSISVDLSTEVTRAKFKRDGLDLGDGNLRSFGIGLTAAF